MRKDVRKYATPLAIASIALCVLLTVFSVPLDRISAYLMELVPVMFLLFLFANSLFALIESLADGDGPAKLSEDPGMRVLVIALRSFLATAGVLILSFLAGVLSLALRFLLDHIRDWLSVNPGSSLTLTQGKE